MSHRRTRVQKSDDWHRRLLGAHRKRRPGTGCPNNSFDEIMPRIASPRGFRSAPTVAYRDAITAGIYDRRNGVQGSVCTAPIPSRPCPLWVKSRHDTLKSRCPLYPQQRTSVFSRYFRAYPEIGWPGVRSMAMVRTRSRGIKDAALGHAAGLARAPDAHRIGAR